MSKTKNKKVRLKAKKIKKTKKTKSVKPVKRKKVLIYPVKSRKTKVVKKVKLSKRVKKVKKVFKKIKKAIKPKQKNKSSLRAAAKQSHKKIRLLRRQRAPRNNKKTTEFPVETLFKARIKVIGVGGGGGSIVSEIGRSLEKATFVIADTDARALKKKSGIKDFWFGQDLTHGLGTGVNVDLGKQAAESAKEKISGIFKDQDIIIFIASLGGGLGSGATQVFAEAAREFGGITFGIFTMPFKFEGKNKYRIAQNALRSLRQSLNVSLVIPNEKIFKIIDVNTPITDAFSIVNKSLIESLESLIDLIYNPGIINIDFADLRTILKGRGNTAFLNTIEESGKNRAEKICEKVLVNPLLQSSSFEAEKILFNISGSENLSMFEVEKVSSYIANLNPKAKIIFGISKNQKLKNKIKTTILMTGGEMKEEPFAIKSEPVKAVQKEQTEEQKKKEAEEISQKTESEKKPEIIKKNKKSKPPKTRKPAAKKPAKKTKKSSSHPVDNKEKEEKLVPLIPVFQAPVSSVPILDQRRVNIVETASESTKKTIRRSGLEIKKAEELEEKKRMAQEKEWEIPAFLRRVKFKN